jgi:hypothetical protein
VRAGSDEKFWLGPSEFRGRDDEVRLRRQLLSSFDSFEASESLSWPSSVDSPLSLLRSPSNSAELICVLSSCDVDLSSLLRTVYETDFSLEIDVLAVVGARFRGSLESLNQWIGLCLDCVPNLSGYRRVSAWNGFCRGIIQADFPPAGLVAAPAGVQFIGVFDSRLGKQTLHSQRETHVTGNSQFAAHERDLAVELAGRHINVVLRSHRNRDAR